MGCFASLKTEERRRSSHQERDGNRGMKVAGQRERGKELESCVEEGCSQP